MRAASRSSSALPKVINKEYAKTYMTVNAIAPAVVKTQMVADMPAEQVAYMTAKISAGRGKMLCVLSVEGVRTRTAWLPG